jgi:RimJ/RimL family protein N-acetyltransferase
MPSSAIAPVTLVGGVVRLEPARTADAGPMARAADAETFRFFVRSPTPWNEMGCAAYLGALLDDPTVLPFSAFDVLSGRLIGGTSYCDIRPAHRGLEIGWTWIAAERRGTRVNPEMKLLMLRHAFETDLFPAGPAIRVQLKTHHLNVHSRAAILKLGATHEGVLRNHAVMPDGSLRHTAMYSITTDEWPAVRAKLEARLRAPER